MISAVHPSKKNSVNQVEDLRKAKIQLLGSDAAPLGPGQVRVTPDRNPQGTSVLACSIM
jgi:hypothetical protein